MCLWPKHANSAAEGTINAARHPSDERLALAGCQAHGAASRVAAHGKAPAESTRPPLNPGALFMAASAQFSCRLPPTAGEPFSTGLWTWNLVTGHFAQPSGCVGEVVQQVSRGTAVMGWARGRAELRSAATVSIQMTSGSLSRDVCSRSASTVRAVGRRFDHGRRACGIRSHVPQNPSSAAEVPP